MRPNLLCIALISAFTLSACTTVSAAVPKAKPKTKLVPAINLNAPLDKRVAQLDAVIKAKIAPDEYFAPSFLSAISAAQVVSIFDSFIAQHGQPLQVLSATPRGKYGATVRYAFERSVATIEIDVMEGEENKVIGMLVTGFTTPDDTLERVATEIKSLPGRAGFMVAELDDKGGARLLETHRADEQFAIGSTFKLYILAELANQVKNGERSWNDIAPLAHRSFSSAATSSWPKDSPMTLHSMATMMISVSDNSATDSLLFKLGREAVERRLAGIGHGAPDKTLPFLSTVEAFALKANPELRDRFMNVSEAAQRDLLTSEAAALTLDKIDNEALSKGPTAIDSIEWFASPGDLMLLLNSIRETKNDDMLAIMGVNPGISPAARGKWRYIGYKGGSEPGVMSMSFLLQNQKGKWFAVTGSWNDTAAEVDNTRFATLMERLVSAIPE